MEIQTEVCAILLFPSPMWGWKYRLKSVLLIFLEFQLGDCFAVNLVRPVPKTQDSSACPRRSKLEFLRHTAPSACLYRPIEHSQSHIRCDDFYHCDLSA